jgi:epoxyqueuosine reductase QueG
MLIKRSEGRAARARLATAFRGLSSGGLDRRGFLRNVAVVLGNIGTAADLPALKVAAQDPEPLVAEHAQWALEEITRRRGG